MKRLAVVVTLIAAVAAQSLTAGAAERIKIVAFGDSLTAGWGLSPDDAFPARLQRALAARGFSVNIINAGISGDTAPGGLARLDWSIPSGTDAVILELGGNDALMYADPSVTKDALDQIIRRLKARNIAVLLCGMKAPRHYSADYIRAFDGLFPQLAANHGLLFYPFFLDGVVYRQERTMPDGIHPNAAGVDQIVARIYPKVEQLIAQARQRRPATTTMIRDHAMQPAAVNSHHP